MAQKASRRPPTAESRDLRKVQSTWDLWWTKLHWNMFFTKFFGFRFFSVSIIIPPELRTHIGLSSSRGRTIVSLVATVRRHSLNSWTKKHNTLINPRRIPIIFSFPCSTYYSVGCLFGLSMFIAVCQCLSVYGNIFP
jgi:hypothetical protein